MDLKNFLRPTWKKVITLMLLVVFFSVSLRLSLGVYPYWFQVGSDAMYPAYKFGDMVLVKKVDFTQLKVSDVVIFQSPQFKPLLIMRIVSIDYENKVFTTKGDNNPDSVQFEKDVPSDNIHGKVVFSIPFLGYLDHYHVGGLFRLTICYLLACLISFGIKKR